MPIHQATLSLNAGEVSPYLVHRTDFEKHPFASATVENLLPLPYGGVRKRPGTVYRSALSAATALYKFSYSTTTGYILAVSSTALDIYGSDGVLRATIAATFADPFSLHLSHVNDVLFITTGTEQERRLTRTSDSVWTLEDIPWSFPPLLDQNDDEDLTITTTFDDATSATPWALGTSPYNAGEWVSHGGADYLCIVTHANAAFYEPGVGAFWDGVWVLDEIEEASAIGSTVTLTAASALFVAGHLGAYWLIEREREADQFEVDLDLTSSPATDTSATLVIQGRWVVNTFGHWDGTVKLQKSVDQGITWTTERQWVAEDDRNIDAAGTEPARVLMRLSWTWNAASVAGRAVLSSLDNTIGGLCKITAVNSTLEAEAQTITPIERCTTDLWSEGAFSTHRGFPVATALHERRLIFAGTITAQGRPVTLWTSATDDLLNFKTGTEDDDGIRITLAATEQNPIRWVSSQRRLFVGTAGGEWVFGSETTDSPLTPTNLLARKYTNYGSAKIPALTVNDAVFFLERQGRRVRELAYLIERETYDAADLNRLAEHITEGGIIQLAYQHNREPVLWAVRADGTLLAFNYVRPERIAAWTRHTTSGGLFESVAVLRNDSGDDSVFVVVNRSGSRSLESFATGQQALQEAGTIASAIHVDGCSTGSTDSTGTMGGLSHLNNIQCAALADGAWYTLTPTAGIVTLPDGISAAQLTIGRLVTSKLTTLPLDLQLRDGATHGRRKRAHEIYASLYQSYGGGVNVQALDEGRSIAEEPMAFDESTDAFSGPATLFTGWKKQQLPQGYADDIAITITHATPHPFTLRSIVTHWQLHES